jgi:hypothetical protein
MVSLEACLIKYPVKRSPEIPLAGAPAGASAVPTPAPSPLGGKRGWKARSLRGAQLLLVGDFPSQTIDHWFMIKTYLRGVLHGVQGGEYISSEPETQNSYLVNGVFLLTSFS